MRFLNGILLLLLLQTFGLVVNVNAERFDDDNDVRSRFHRVFHKHILSLNSSLPPRFPTIVTPDEVESYGVLNLADAYERIGSSNQHDARITIIPKTEKEQGHPHIEMTYVTLPLKPDGLVFSIRAKLDGFLLNKRGNTCGADIKKAMADMDHIILRYLKPRSPKKEIIRYRSDECGHIVATSLGGPNAPYNIIPMAPQLNHMRCPGTKLGWNDVETKQLTFLDENWKEGGYIDWRGIILYEESPGKRPTGIAIHFTMHHPKGAKEEGSYYYPNPRNTQPEESCEHKIRDYDQERFCSSVRVLQTQQG